MSLVGTSPTVAPFTSRDTEIADGGNAFVAINPTAGTGIISATPITLAAAATAATMVVYNGNTGAATTASNAVNIYPLYLKLFETAASTGGTQLNFQWHVDNINRYTSGGTALTINNTNRSSTVSSNAVINFGNLTSVGANSDKQVSGNLRCRLGAIDIAGDQLFFNFGGPTIVPPTTLATTATIGIFSFGVMPVVIGPGQSLVFTIWQPTTFSTGVTYEVEFGYIEK
jgi:hypothetical protein